MQKLQRGVFSNKKFIVLVRYEILVRYLIERFDVSGNSFPVSTSVLGTSCRSSPAQSHEEFLRQQERHHMH
jgi:hypothetical protein